MVKLNKIYTRTGDDGSTGLGDGSRRQKHDLRIAAYGTTDEASSALGLALVHGLDGELEGIVQQLQNDLFDVGADLCVPGTGGDGLRIAPAYTARVEQWIDQYNERLQPLRSFVLPGGSAAAAWLHFARTVCRRAERLVSELGAVESEAAALNPEVLRFLNRLSDLLFVLARVANDDGRADVLWRPGGGGDGVE